MLDLGSVIENDIGLIGMQRGIILVIRFGGVEILQGHDLGDDGARKYLGVVQLRGRA